MRDAEIAHLELDEAELAVVFGGSAMQERCAQEAEMYSESTMM